MDKKIENNTAEIVANMALAHEMIMNDSFELKSINDASNRYILFLIFACFILFQFVSFTKVSKSIDHPIFSVHIIKIFKILSFSRDFCKKMHQKKFIERS